MLGKVTERMWPTVDPEVRPGQLEAHHPLPCPWNVPSAHCSHSGNRFQGSSLGRVMCCWGSLVGIHDWTQLRPLCKLLFTILGGEWRDWLIFWPPKTNLVCRFTCLLKLPPTNLSSLPLVSPCPLYTGINFIFHLGSFPDFEPTVYLTCITVFNWL